LDKDGNLKKVWLICLLFLCAGATNGRAAVNKPSDIHPNAVDIVGQCSHQAVQQDLTATMTIINRHRNGAEKKSIYKRLVKNAHGADEVLEKMLLISEYPPEAVGLAFLRWEYTADADKYPDQWLYTPSLRNVRKVSVRDDQERFLGSTLTLGDIGVRPIHRDDHRLLSIENSGQSYRFQFESTPVNQVDAYSKRLVDFIVDNGWDSCRVAKIEYYDRKGLLQKIQKNQWQKVDHAWVWRHVEVENLQTQELSIFQLENVKVDVGLDDDIFSERQLRRITKRATLE
jgi:hypothetical protein